MDGLVHAVGTINLRILQHLWEADFRNDFQLDASAARASKPNALGAALAVQAAGKVCLVFGRPFAWYTRRGNTWRTGFMTGVEYD